MKFALLGFDADTLDLARAVIAAGHALGGAYDVDAGQAAQLRTIVPNLHVGDGWEVVLDASAAEAVIVARGEHEDPRAEQLRKLFQVGLPLIVAHPVNSSMLVYYELDMIRQDTGVLALPYVPERWHPATQKLADTLAAGEASPLGKVEQVVFERALPDRTRRRVLDHFARDVSLAQRLCNELTKVGAMTTPGREPDYANLGIQMSGPSGIVVRWTVGPVEETAGLKLSLIGTRGKATLHIPAEGHAWTLDTLQDGKRSSEQFSDWAPAAEGVTRLTAAVNGGKLEPTWLMAARDLELADAVERSVRRGRTIDLFYEEQTEHGTFKGMMAAGGCALLMGALVLLVVATTAVHFRFPFADLWPYALLAVLGVFLLLQLLKLAFPSKDEQ